MAKITIGELNKYVDYWANFNSLVQGHKEMKTEESLGWAKNSVKINADDPRWKKVKKPDDLAAAFAGTGKHSRSVILPAYTGKYGSGKTIDINLGHLSKDNIKGQSRAKYNLGNVAEGVLAAALAARFENKDKDITPSILASMVQRCITVKKQSGIQLDFKSPNHVPANYKKAAIPDDDILLTIKLAKADLDFFTSKDSKEVKIREDLYKSCCHYCNGNEISTLATECYMNRMYDKIEIIADGNSNQKGTKVDIKLQINDDIDFPISGVRGDSMDITQISLKRSVGQFGQTGGWDLDRQSFFWMQLMQRDPEDDQTVVTKWAKALKKGEIEQQRCVYAVQVAYDWAFAEIKKDIKKPDFFDRLDRGINYFATKGEKNVKIVELSGDVSIVYDFTRLGQLLEGGQLVLEVKMSKSATAPFKSYQMPDKPIIQILDKNATGDDSKRSLINLRLKFEAAANKGNGYFRNLVEKGPRLKNYLSLNV